MLEALGSISSTAKNQKTKTFKQNRGLLHVLAGREQKTHRRNSNT
jgi:hypothetical protein